MRDLKDHLVPAPPPQTGTPSTRPCCLDSLSFPDLGLHVILAYSEKYPCYIVSVIPMISQWQLLTRNIFIYFAMFAKQHYFGGPKYMIIRVIMVSLLPAWLTSVKWAVGFYSLVSVAVVASKWLQLISPGSLFIIWSKAPACIAF